MIVIKPDQKPTTSELQSTSPDEGKFNQHLLSYYKDTFHFCTYTRWWGFHFTNSPYALSISKLTYLHKYVFKIRICSNKFLGCCFDPTVLKLSFITPVLSKAKLQSKTESTNSRNFTFFLEKTTRGIAPA